MEHTSGSSAASFFLARLALDFVASGAAVARLVAADVEDVPPMVALAPSICLFLALVTTPVAWVPGASSLFWSEEAMVTRFLRRKPLRWNYILVTQVIIWSTAKVVRLPGLRHSPD